MQKIYLTYGTHRGNSVIFLDFFYNKLLIEKAKEIGATWSSTNKKWYLRYSKSNLRLVYSAFRDFILVNKNENPFLKLTETKIIKSSRKKIVRKKIDAKKVSKYHKKLLHEYVNYLRGKMLSKSTVRTYYTHILEFFYYLKSKPLEEITNRDIEKFIEEVYVPRKYAVSTHRQVYGALKHLKNRFPECLIDETEFELPKKTSYLPTVLSKEEVIHLLRATKNLKHRAILAMIYSSGMRIGELINLELKDIDFNRLQIFIRNGKGRKDRYVVMAKSMLPLIRNYLTTYRPIKYFVESTERGKPYSAGSVRSFLRRLSKQSGITKKVTPHTLRHCYATHLLENGVDLRYIQELLGHSRPETTMIYTHVAKKDLLEIESPLDYIVKELLQTSKRDKNLTLSRDISL